MTTHAYTCSTLMMSVITEYSNIVISVNLLKDVTLFIAIPCLLGHC